MVVCFLLAGICIMSKDYYSILGVDKKATQEEIKKAFRKKAHEFHPDKKGGDEAKFKELNEAYQILGNEQKRSQYDQYGQAWNGASGQGGKGGFGGFEGFQNGGFNINMDDLGDIFGGFSDFFSGGASHSSNRSRRGSDLQMSVQISFNDAIFGAEKEIGLIKNVRCKRCDGGGAEPGAKIETCKTCRGSGRVTRIQRSILGNIQVQTTCPECSGEGKTFSKKCSACNGHGFVKENVKLKVKIPAGIDDNEVIRLSGQGEAGEKGGAGGDLYLKIKVTPSIKFKRDGYDISSIEEISFSQAALGDKIEVETVSGKVKLKIPPGTQSHTVFKLKNKGVIRLQGRGQGDHLVKIIIKTPTSLNREQKRLIQELGSL